MQVAQVGNALIHHLSPVTEPGRMMDREALEEKETVRMEPFSDGVFAFAITLLGLNLRDPSGTGGTFFVLAIVWNGLWWYCTSRRRLLGRDVTDQQANTITRQYRVAPVSYGVALLIAPFNGIASVAVILAVAGFFAITATLAHEA